MQTSSSRSKIRHLLCSIVLATVCFAPRASAVLPGAVVSYNPVSKAVYGDLPTTGTYTLSVTAPTSIAFPVTVTLENTATAVPLGTAETALSYVQFSTNTLTFTTPGQTLSVTVDMNFPASALSAEVPSGIYTYRIKTLGWPVGVMDNGATISASVSLPSPPTGNAPTVTITTPPDGQVFEYAAIGGLPAVIPFTFDASADAGSPAITSVSASFGSGATMLPVIVTAQGLNTNQVTATGSMVVALPGTYTLEARATNAVGQASDVNTYIIRVAGVAPTVSISQPVAGSTFTYRLGDPATVVTFSFTANSSYGGIRTLSATVDGVAQTFVPTGLNTLTATGTILLPYTTSGAHTVSVVATDDYGTATAESNFTINVIAPTPALNISNPGDNQVFTLPVGSTTMNVPYSFTTTSNNGFVVNSVTASLGATTLAPTTVGIGTPAATSTGTLQNLTAGTYTLTATGASAGITATDTVTFTVVGAAVPPSVTIDTPPEGATFTKLACGPALQIPLTFTGTSNTPGAVITQLKASLDGVPVSVSSSTLGQPVATGTATLFVTSAGTHTISVTAKDAHGTANATRTFTVTVSHGQTVYGEVFFDIDLDGVQDPVEFGLSCIRVKLVDGSNRVVDTDYTSCNGSYSFSRVAPGAYTVEVDPWSGLSVTTLEPTVTVSNVNVRVPDIGVGLDFRAIGRMKADGFTIGYWKNNLDKAIAGKTKGTQVSRCTLEDYTDDIGCFAQSPFDDLTMKQASSIMGSNSSKPADLLAKQLLASEYNYQNRAYLNDNPVLTYVFLYWGEHILKNSSHYSSSYILWAKDWFDAYNNSHGGVVDGPSP